MPCSSAGLMEEEGKMVSLIGVWDPSVCVCVRPQLWPFYETSFPPFSASADSSVSASHGGSSALAMATTTPCDPMRCDLTDDCQRALSNGRMTLTHGNGGASIFKDHQVFICGKKRKKRNKAWRKLCSRFFFRLSTLNAHHRPYTPPSSAIIQPGLPGFLLLPT